MYSFLSEHFLWLKALHVIAVISWMAGLLYLPRLFVYHAAAAPGSDQSETFKVMEARLLRYIMNPAMIATFLFGGLMIWINTGYMQLGWMHGKLTLVFLLTGVHHVFGKWRKDFAADKNTRAPKFYKIWNEVPTALMIGIVLLVVIKPLTGG